MKKRYHLRGLILLTILLVAITACTTVPVAAPAVDPPSEPSTDTTAPAEPEMTEPEAMPLVQLKVITLPFITFSPYYIAVEEGYFAAQGIEVELVDMRRQEEILPALSSGQVDVSSGLVSAGILNAIARGADIKITADKGSIDPEGCVNYALIGRQDRIANDEQATVDQLAGQTINVVPATWLEYYLARLLETADLTIDDIEKVNLTTLAVGEAFTEGQIDAAINSEPWVTRFAAAGHEPILELPQTLLPNDVVAIQVYGPNLLNDNRDVGVRFMVAYLQGVRQYLEGKTERNLDIVADFTQLPRELLETICWPAIEPTGAVNVASVVGFQTWAVSAGYMDAVLAADAFYDASFVEEANSRLDAAP